MQTSRRIALINTQGDHLTFGELELNISAIIGELRRINAKSDCTVAVILAKSFEAVTVIYALHEERITYVPIDCDSPYERISKILLDCNPDYIIHDGRLKELGYGTDSSFRLTFGGSIVISKTGKEARHSSTVSSIAYILYTSGSTGIPKGVMVPSSAADAFVNWCISTFAIHADDIIASISPFHFDLSVCDLFASRKTGATMLLLNKETVSNPRLAAQYLSENKVTFIYATPSFFTSLINYGKTEKYEWSTMKNILFAGEVFHPKALHALMSTMNCASFYNLYGPTETNVCTYHKITIDSNRSAPYPIGKPCDGHQYEISAEGELLIGGPHVAEGYLNQKERTAERFFSKNNLRWFRTGDLVKMENEELIYCGRIDQMIKRRGYRIEPGEIEHAALQISNVTSTACFPKTDADNEIKIILVCEGSIDSDQTEFRSYLLKYIPDYMLPDIIVLNSVIPLTSTGKTDYNKLSAQTRYF